MIKRKMMFKEIKEYFKYNPESMHFGHGAYMVFALMYFGVKEVNLWIFLLPLICLAYSGKRFFIILASIGELAYISYLYKFWNNEMAVVISFFNIITFILFYRDMYFLYKYRMNAFTYKDKTLEDIISSKMVFKVFFALSLVICLIIYGLGKWYNW